MSQARINWEVCSTNGIRHKIGGMMEVGASMVRMGWRPVGLLVHLPLLSSQRLIKSRDDRLSQHVSGVSGWMSLVPAHPGSPGQRAVKWQCMCVHWPIRSVALFVTESQEAYGCEELVQGCYSTAQRLGLKLATTESPVTRISSHRIHPNLTRPKSSIKSVRACRKLTSLVASQWVLPTALTITWSARNHVLVPLEFGNFQLSGNVFSDVECFLLPYRLFGTICRHSIVLMASVDGEFVCELWTLLLVCTYYLAMFIRRVLHKWT